MEMASFEMTMKQDEFLSIESEPVTKLMADSNHQWINTGDIYYDAYFIGQLRKEKLRAKRSKSKLSIILLTLSQNTDAEAVDMNKILDHVQTKIRDTDISGFVNDKTIGLLLTDTDEKGSRELCEKLVNGNKQAEFTITTSTYPGYIFESLAKIGGIRPDAFPFKTDNSMGTVCFNLLIKRAIDIIGSIVGIFAFMPVMLMTALATKVTSSEPVITKQIRLGRQGVPFTLYNFRDIHVNINEPIPPEYARDFIDGKNITVNQGNGAKPLHKIQADPRITSESRFIRKTLIDKLPQLFNVLKGEMSLVGPRPAFPYEAEKYQHWQLRRILEMKPGFTGLWQVDGRTSMRWDDTVRLDIRYIQRWTLMLDFKILFKTIKVVVTNKWSL